MGFVPSRVEIAFCLQECDKHLACPFFATDNNMQYSPFGGKLTTSI